MDSLLQALPPPAAFFGQLLIGLINGGFYAMLSLGLAVIFGLLGIVNFAHGAQYMLGALGALSATAPAELLLSRTGWRGLFEVLAVVSAVAAEKMTIPVSRTIFRE